MTVVISSAGTGRELYSPASEKDLTAVGVALSIVHEGAQKCGYNPLNCEAHVVACDLKEGSAQQLVTV